MTQEDYVNFEIAKLLKEKGFNEPCVYVYRHDSSEDIWDADREDIACQKPTIQMAMKWLREVHGLFIEIHIIGHSTAYMDNKYYFYKLYKNRRPMRFEDNTFLTYEQAAEAAIKYCLENLL